MFRRLTKDELADLTGRKRRAAILEWLRAQGWTFECDANGWPIVSAAYAERRLGGLCGADDDARPRRPNFAALERVA
jgi:hypothetical protein